MQDMFESLSPASGLIGGLLCCDGDILFDLKGKYNQKPGTSGAFIFQ